MENRERKYGFIKSAFLLYLEGMLHLLKAVQKLEVLGVFAIAVVLSLQLISFQADREIKAWQILTAASSGNNGKVKALEFLAKRGLPLHHMNLSCENVGAGRFDDKGKFTCTYPPYLGFLNLHRGVSRFFLPFNHITDLRLSSFDSANLFKANFDGVILNFASFKDAYLYNSSFKGSSLKDVDFSGSYVAKADFRKSLFFDKRNFRNSWVWSDIKEQDLPKFPNNLEAKKIIKLCNPGKNNSFRNKMDRFQFTTLPSSCK